MDYSENNTEIYRLGKTGNMNKRKKIYDTHTLHKKDVIYYKETKCPLRLETCVRSMLYDHRYKDKKDFFICSLAKIKNAFKNLFFQYKDKNFSVYINYINKFLIFIYNKKCLRVIFI